MCSDGVAAPDSVGEGGNGGRWWKGNTKQSSGHKLPGGVDPI